MEEPLISHFQVWSSSLKGILLEPETPIPVSSRLRLSLKKIENNENQHYSRLVLVFIPFVIINSPI